MPGARGRRTAIRRARDRRRPRGRIGDVDREFDDPLVGAPFAQRPRVGVPDDRTVDLADEPRMALEGRRDPIGDLRLGGDGLLEGNRRRLAERRVDVANGGRVGRSRDPNTGIGCHRSWLPCSRNKSAEGGERIGASAPSIGGVDRQSRRSRRYPRPGNETTSRRQRSPVISSPCDQRYLNDERRERFGSVI